MRDGEALSDPRKIDVDACYSAVVLHDESAVLRDGAMDDGDAELLRHSVYVDNAIAGDGHAGHPKNVCGELLG